jgi:inorganic triphosphatase YgiF
MITEIPTEMTNVTEFIRIRQRIELLAKQIESTIKEKAADESSKKLEEASELLVRLTDMANNDIQDIVIGRLTRQLASFGIKVGKLPVRKRVVKKQLVVVQ